MLNNLLAYITPENIYLVANWGVIPFWLLLIFAQIMDLQIFLRNLSLLLCFWLQLIFIYLMGFI